MADLIDPTQTGNYPVILSDRLLKKQANEIFTGVRCEFPPFARNLFVVGLIADSVSLTDNHKPNLSADSTRARLKPAGGAQPNSFDLNFLGGDGRTEYAFAGARTVGDGQYVLYFDPNREAFVLDRMDSTFHMNLTRTPSNSDPESLSRKYPHLNDSAGASSSRPSKSQPAGEGKPMPARAKSPPPRTKDPSARKPERKAAPQPKNVNLALPQADKAKSKAKSRPAEEEDDDEGDDLLQVEYPGGEPSKSQSRDFSPAFPSVRRFDEFMDQRESEADDADGESLGEPDTDFKLPSPVNNHRQPDDDDNEEPEPMDVDQEHDRDDGADAGSPNLEDDLEKDLEEAFEAVANSQNGTPADGDESEISEED